jgi:hypothetical protein
MARFRAALMIKLGCARSMTSAAIVALTLISGCVSWAQTCPTSPSYSPDFSSNQSCLSLLGNGYSSSPTKASLQSIGGSVLLQITPNSSQQRGYAWYTTPQPVGNSFSTTFTFQLTGASQPPADGFAFVIQNSSTGASTVGPTGSDGCGLGFGDDPTNAGGSCVSGTGGITNSVAVGFKTYNSGAGLPYPDSVFIASNGTGANCVDTTSPNCVIAENDLSGADSEPNPDGCSGTGICLADGNVHTVTVTYTTQPSASQTNCSAGCLDVILDGTDLFPHGVSFNMTSIGLTNNTAYVGFTGATGGSVENNDILSWIFSTQNFGNVNVCPSGQTTPAPCSATQTVTFNFTATTPVSQIRAVTQGTPDLDFSAPNSGACINTFNAGGSCTVNVMFTPTAPGLRLGAVELLSDGGELLATQLIYGIGVAPEIAFGPTVTYTLPLTAQGNITFSSQVTQLSNPFGYPSGGMTTDATGDLYLVGQTTPSTGQLLELAPPYTGSPTTVAAGFINPQSVAIDGAGNLYVADSGLNSPLGEVVELAPGCGSVSCGTPVYMPTVHPSPVGVAVDGLGDVFIADNPAGIIEIPVGCTSSSCWSTVYSGASGSQPAGVAVDAAGDVFVADSGLAKVVEVPAGCTTAGCQIQVGSGWVDPLGVAVDPAGDVIVADFEFTVDGQGDAGALEEVPAGCTSSNCQVLLLTAGAPDPAQVTVSSTGQLFVATDGPLYEINQSQPPSLTFAATYQGSTSVGSPQTVSVQNIGNAALDFTAISFPLDFPQVGDENDCSIATLLTPGLVCPLTIDFTPTMGGPPPAGTPLTEAVGLTDNALNVTGATQSISVQGSGLSPEVAVPAVVGDTLMAATTSITGSGLAVGNVTSQSSTVPIGEVVSESPSAGTLVTIPSSVGLVISLGEAVPNVVNQTESAAGSSITAVGLVVGTVTTQFSDTVPSGSVISESPDAGTAVNGGSSVNLVVSNGVPPAQDQLTLENNYFVTGDYASGGVTLHGVASGTITIPDASPCAAPACGPGVPDGTDIIDGFLYWTTIETSPTPTGNTGTFLGYSITGQQIGSDVPNYSDGTYTGTLRVYRADVNNYFQVPSTWNGARQGSGQFTVTLPNSGGTITEGASLVVIYRVLSTMFPLKSVVIYDGSIAPTSTTGNIPQAVQGFYDAVGGANGTGEVTHLYTSGGSWNDSESPQTLGQSNQYIDTLSTGNAYAAVILSTPVNNSDNDGILDAWKTAQGYTDVKTGSWVPLPGATHGEEDLFVQFDYMCSVIDPTTNNCDLSYPNLYPSPDAQGNDPLAMVTQAFANYGVHLHLKPGNAIPESTCTDSQSQFCEFPNQPGVVAWNGSVELSKVWPINFAACTANPSPANCVPRFPYGQKDSYHYVLFGYSLAIPAWTTRAGSITSITTTSGGAGTIVTTGLGTTCPTRITISGVQGNPNLNAIYDQLSCDSGLTTIYFSTPSTVPAWTYPNSTLPEPVIAVTSGTVTSISGYSDLGGSDSVVSLGQWESSLTQDMSKSATVVAGTLFHELGHTLGLSHGGLYFDTPGSYIPTFEANCKPNFQSSMNYLFQLDGVGPNAAITYSNQALFGEAQGPSPTPTILGGDGGTTNFTTIPIGSVVNLTDAFGNPASFTTSAWYTTVPPSSTASAATMHCDGSPLNNDTAYRVNGPVDSISPAWSTGQNITFDGAPYSDLRGYSDKANLDLRQVGATSGDFASLANATSYTTGGVTFGGSGGVTYAGSGGVTYGGSGGVTFAGSGGVLFAGSGGVLFAGSGGVTFAGSGGVTYAGSGGVTFAGSGGVTFAGSGGVTFAGSGGVTFAGSGGASTNELDYLTANSFVRPPNSPTITPVMTNGAVTSVTVDWTAPAFGVVQYYTVYRGCNPNGSDAVNIGVVNGVGGAAPATEFIDSNPVTCSGSSGVVYTISTTLNPVQIDPTQRSSAPSVPAIVKNFQTIVLGALPGSVTLSNTPLTVYATAETNGNPNGLQVDFVATGPCSVGSQTVTPVVGSTGGVSSASVTLLNQGSCTITASQPGTNPTASSTPPYYDAANSVSGTFTILPAGSTLQSQTISWSTLPSVQYGGTFSLSATAESSGRPDGLPVTFSASGPCTPSGATTGVGRCTITASQAGNSTFSSVSVSQSFTITPAVLTVTATSFPSVTYGQAIPTLTPSLGVTYSLTGFVKNGLGQLDTSSVVTGTPALSTTANQGSSPGNYPITISTGSLAAANYSFYLVNGTLTIVPASQAITLTGVPPMAAYNTSFTAVVAMAGASGNPVTFTSSGACSITSTAAGTATYMMTNSTGACSVIANQAASTNYSMAPTVTQIVNANGPLVTVSPSTINFGSVTQGSITTENITVSNIGSAPATISQPLISIVQGGNSNEFVAVNLCPTPLAAGKSCTITIAFVAGPYYTQQTATLEIMDNAPGSPQPVTMSATVLQPQTITFATNSPPASAAYKSSFTVAATASSGLPVTFTASGACSVAPGTATYTMTSGTGTCSVIANQAGNLTYAPAAQVTRTVTATQASQTITITNSPPPSAAYKTSFTVAATASSGLAVTFTSSGACSISGSTYTMTSGTGTCSVIANQAGNSNYSAATQVTKSVSATPAAQTITFTTNPPATAAYKSSFTVAATASSGLAVTFTSSGSCGNSGATYTMTASTGTCSVVANQAGNSNYSAAPPVTLPVSATQAPQTITFSTNPPATAAYNSTFKVAATGGASGNAVTFTSSGSCSNSGATYTMTSGTGTCSVIANQAGNSNYAAAAQVTKTVSATLVAQTITFTTNPPATAALNSSFTVAATGGASGNAVVFTSSGACTNSGATYKMTSGTGTCSVIANQAGNSNYAAAPQVTKTVTAK